MNPIKTLPATFYQREDVVLIARELIGKWLCTADGCAGMIIETEAYAGVNDQASHAFGGRRTPRTEVMYCDGGITYIYFCYGMHHLLNVVTHRTGTPHAVLIRALHPTDGIELMKERRGRKNLTDGPATLCQALGLTLVHNALSLQGPQIWIEDRGAVISEIIPSPRIGIDYAGEDARLPYRFSINPDSVMMRI